MPSDAAKVFVSYTQTDRAWAEWIAWQLEEVGYEAVLQAWSFGSGSNFVYEMHRAIQEVDRGIAVLSPDYERSALGFAEFAGMFIRPNEVSLIL